MTDVANAYVRTYMHANTDVCLHTHKGAHKKNIMITQSHAVYNDEVVVVVAYEDEWQRYIYIEEYVCTYMHTHSMSILQALLFLPTTLQLKWVK